MEEKEVGREVGQSKTKRPRLFVLVTVVVAVIAALVSVLVSSAGPSAASEPDADAAVGAEISDAAVGAEIADHFEDELTEVADGLKVVLSPLVADGTLTQAQLDAVIEAFVETARAEKQAALACFSALDALETKPSDLSEVPECAELVEEYDDEAHGLDGDSDGAHGADIAAYWANELAEASEKFAVVLSPLVADGTLTQAQVDAVIEAFLVEIREKHQALMACFSAMEAMDPKPTDPANLPEECTAVFGDFEFLEGHKIVDGDEASEIEKDFDATVPDADIGWWSEHPSGDGDGSGGT